MAQTIPTGTFGVAKWVVSADATQGTHTTIAAAITSASSGDIIWIREGTYTENLTLKAGVCLIGMSQRKPTIIGKCLANTAGTFTLENLILQTNGDYCLSCTGSVVTAVIVNDCYISATNNTGIDVSSSGVDSGIEMYNSEGKASAGFAIFALSNAASNLSFGNCYFDLFSLSQSTTANTVSAGDLVMRHCGLDCPLTVSGTGTARLDYCVLDMLNNNTTALTVTAGTVVSFNNVYSSGSASAISVAGSLFSYGDIISSSNTNAVTGAGTITYQGMMFSGTSSTINTTTQARGTYKGVQTNTTPAAGFIGEQIRATVSQGSPVTLTTTNTQQNITNISLTPGLWSVSLLAGFSGNVTGTRISCSISTTSATGGTQGDNRADSPAVPTSGSDSTLSIPDYVISLAATTTVYFVAFATWTVTAPVVYGRISAIRIA